MNYYENELKALKKSGRLRQRELYPENIKDFATNDYLGLAHQKSLHVKTSKQLLDEDIFASKASLLVGGYHKIHQQFEQKLCALNGFEEGVVVGSGFNANIALIEALVRKNDVLLMDENYHASGVLPSQLPYIDVVFFRHNDMSHLEELLRKYNSKKRRIIAVEGIYSMEGDMVPKEVFALANKYKSLLVVDEAHSSGIVGENLLGVFDYYDIEIKSNFIKMGTLGKGYGSFGAYILASKHIINYLLNRAKPLIYATALSLYDTLLATNALEYIQQNRAVLKEKITTRQRVIKEILSIEIDGLILPVVVNDNKKVIQIKNELLKEGYFIGAIREPTVPKAILRIIARISEDEKEFEKLLKIIKNRYLC